MNVNTKGLLQEWLAKRGKDPPLYQTHKVGEPAHVPVWRSTVTCDGLAKPIVGPEAHSSKAAEALVAELAYEALRDGRKQRQPVGPVSHSSPHIITKPSERSFHLAQALAGLELEDDNSRPKSTKPLSLEEKDSAPLPLVLLPPSHFSAPPKRIVVIVDGEQQLEAVGELAKFMQPSQEQVPLQLAVYVVLTQISRQRLERAISVPEWVQFVEVPEAQVHAITYGQQEIIDMAIVGQTAILASQGTFSHFVIVSSGQYAQVLQHLLQQQQWCKRGEVAHVNAALVAASPQFPVKADVVTSQDLSDLITSLI